MKVPVYVSGKVNVYKQANKFLRRSEEPICYKKINKKGIFISTYFCIMNKQFNTTI